jgi:hypothetical protein
LRPARTAMLVLSSALALATSGCFQELDSRAGKGSAPVAAEKVGPTIVLETPAIDLPDGTTTRDPCVLITSQATSILQANCAHCHGGGSPGARQGQPPFDCVLDFEKLKTMTSTSVRDPRDPSRGMRFLIPGDPDNSRLYVRIARAEMPPVPPLGLDPIPLPSVSDVSLLRTWISSCLGIKASAGAGGATAGSPAVASASLDGGVDVTPVDVGPASASDSGRSDPPVSRLNAGRIPLHPDGGAGQ